VWIGPFDRLPPKDEVMADVRRSTDDPAHIDWVSRVYDGTAVSEHEAGLLAMQLHQRLDRLEEALRRRRFLVGDDFTIADVSVFPRVAMYPLVRVAIESEHYPNVSRWMAELSERPSLRRSESVRPD